MALSRRCRSRLPSRDGAVEVTVAARPVFRLVPSFFQIAIHSDSFKALGPRLRERTPSVEQEEEEEEEEEQ